MVNMVESSIYGAYNRGWTDKSRQEMRQRLFMIGRYYSETDPHGLDSSNKEYDVYKDMRNLSRYTAQLQNDFI